MDFVLAYPQAEVERNIYIKLPKGFSLSGKRSNKTHVLKLLKKYIWIETGAHLHKGLVKLGYQQSKVDPCLYYRKNTLLAVYIDDHILAVKEKQVLKRVIK